MEGDEGFSQISGLTDLALTRCIDMSNNTITKSKSPNPQPDEEQPNTMKKLPNLLREGARAMPMVTALEREV
jgi:hypothetical protein